MWIMKQGLESNDKKQNNEISLSFNSEKSCEKSPHLATKSIFLFGMIYNDQSTRPM